MPIPLDLDVQAPLRLAIILDKPTKLAINIEMGQDFVASLMVFNRQQQPLTKSRIVRVKNFEFAVLGVNGQEFDIITPIGKELFYIASKLSSKYPTSFSDKIYTVTQENYKPPVEIFRTDLKKLLDFTAQCANL